MPAVFDHRSRETSLINEALAALQEQAGLTGHLISTNPQVTPYYEADAVVQLERDGRKQVYIVECKTNVDRKSVVARVDELLRDLDKPGMLIAPYISREIAKYCREIDLQFADTQGNAYLNGPGMYVYVSGERRSEAKPLIRSVKSGTNPAPLRVIFVLLCQPELINQAYREIMYRAGVSIGAVSITLDDLKKRGYLIDHETGRSRKLLDRKRLLDEWVTNYSLALRPKLQIRRFSAPNPKWWHQADLRMFGAVWGGEAAAEQLTHYLKSEQQIVYVPPDTADDCLTYLIKNFRLRPDPNGKVEILEKFWNLDISSEVAPPILVYADLMADFDPRNREVAHMIWKKNIESTLD